MNVFFIQKVCLYMILLVDSGTVIFMMGFFNSINNIPIVFLLLKVFELI